MRPADSDTQADTFIEFCFEQKCAELSQGDKILNEWRMRKETYRSYTKTIIFDFQHYSKHDESHSINILNAIDMAIGKKRVELLSASNLWGLLESAYSHDIGMAVSHKELLELWTNDKEFQIYIDKIRDGKDEDLKEAASCYREINNLLNGKLYANGIENINSGNFWNGWPTKLYKCVELLTADYIRKKHADRSRNRIRELLKRDNELFVTRVISDRLYKIVSETAYLHGQNFQDIFTILHYKEIGFDTESMHPQFIAALLRLGDLLDMDNNRFDAYAMNHFGKLPHSSQLHFDKHKALTHFDITPKRIEAKIESNDEEVCRQAGAWFYLLKAEVDNLICDWNRIVPKELRGCLMQRSKLEIDYNGTDFSTIQSEDYKIDKNRLINLMMGNNIYSSRIDCLREYLQNALDASKMQMWIELSRKKIIPKRVNMVKKVSPYDIEKRAFEDKTIEIGVSLNIVEQMVTIRIQDKGIGMEKECVDGLSVVGKSWRQRSIYCEAIKEMPDWLKPTGGFGIGLQSAFMLTDEVIIYSKSEKEAEGYEVHLFSPKKGGSVTKQRDKSKDSITGTKILFTIKLQDLYDFIKEFRELDIRKINKNNTRHDEISFRFGYQKPDDRFLKTANEEYICGFLDCYIRKTIPDTLFPIKTYIDEKKDGELSAKREMSVYSSQFASLSEGFGYDEKSEFLIKKEMGEERYLYTMTEDMTARMWDLKENTQICIRCWPEPFEDLNQKELQELNPICYKNVRVAKQPLPETGMGIPEFLSVCIDIMNGEIENVLSVHRDEFMHSFGIDKKIEDYLKVYIEIMAYVTSFLSDLSNKFKIVMRENEQMPMLEFTLMAIVLRQQTAVNSLIVNWKYKKIYNPEKILMKRIINGAIEETWIDTPTVLSKLADIFIPDRRKENRIVCISTHM
ncbi:MAG: hypothetical protein NC313_05570 [Butyrivibrio sp.]|nr:hypothetical protein [Butyrivibrio sp.]